MSALEHYREDFDAIDREIKRAAFVAGIDLGDVQKIADLIDSPHDPGRTTRPNARERLRGLILLRTKLESELLLDML